MAEEFNFMPPSRDLLDKKVTSQDIWDDHKAGIPFWDPRAKSFRGESNDEALSNNQYLRGVFGNNHSLDLNQMQQSPFYKTDPGVRRIVDQRTEANRRSEEYNKQLYAYDNWLQDPKAQAAYKEYIKNQEAAERAAKYSPVSRNDARHNTNPNNIHYAAGQRKDVQPAAAPAAPPSSGYAAPAVTKPMGKGMMRLADGTVVNAAEYVNAQRAKDLEARGLVMQDGFAIPKEQARQVVNTEPPMTANNINSIAAVNKAVNERNAPVGNQTNTQQVVSSNPPMEKKSSEHMSNRLNGYLAGYMNKTHNKGCYNA